MTLATYKNNDDIIDAFNNENLEYFQLAESKDSHPQAQIIDLLE